MNKKVYLALNIFPHERDLIGLTQFLQEISTIPLDACIVSDFGMAHLIKQYTPFAIHTSTQASVLNSESALMWKDIGAKRVVLAREARFIDAKKIKDHTGLEIELFIHGAMCSSFSGKCTISNVTSGRDSNRGGCVQSCRHHYHLSNNDEFHIMNSKDLMGIESLPQYVDYGIDAVKIEGRMKSALYVANACQQYRQAIDLYFESKTLFNSEKKALTNYLTRVSNRGFTEASLNEPAGKESISYDWNGYSKSLEFMGIIKQSKQGKSLIETKQPFSEHDNLFVIEPGSSQMKPISLSFESLKGQPVNTIGPNQYVWANTELTEYGILVK